MNIKICVLPLLCRKGILFPDINWAQTVGELYLTFTWEFG